MLSFYRPDFCLLRLQICTSWSSPVSATTSTFVLVCPCGPDFQTSTFACYHLSFRSTTFTTFAFASTLNHSCVNVSVLFNFRRSWLSLRLSFPFDISFFPFWLRISLRILFPSAHSASHFFCPLICFFNFSFVSSRSIQFHCCNPKSRRHDPCSKDFREVTHRCCTSKYVRSLQS